MEQREKSISDKWWFRAIINALSTAVISALVYWGFNALKPATPQDKAILKQIEQLEKATQKDTLFIELAKELTGKTDEKTVFSPQDMFEKKDEETLKGSITWLVPDAQKNSMEPILLSRINIIIIIRTCFVNAVSGGRCLPADPFSLTGTFRV